MGIDIQKHGCGPWILENHGDFDERYSGSAALGKRFEDGRRAGGAHGAMPSVFATASLSGETRVSPMNARSFESSRRAGFSHR